MVCLLYDGPVQVTHYPESIKFFNMYRTDRGKLPEDMPLEEYDRRRLTVDCVDFLLPWAGETFGGPRREADHRSLTVKLRESHMFKQMTEIRAGEINNGEVTADIEAAAWEPFESYLELFDPEKHADRKSVTRSGFGLGMGRLLQFLLGSTEVVAL